MKLSQARSCFLTRGFSRFGVIIVVAASTACKEDIGFIEPVADPDPKNGSVSTIPPAITEAEATALSLPQPARYGGAMAISDRGTIAGHYILDYRSRFEPANMRLVRWTVDGDHEDLGGIGSSVTLSRPNAISNNETIVGQLANDSPLSSSAFAWNRKSGLRILQSPPGRSIAHGVNNLEQIVGYAEVPKENSGGTIFTVVDWNNSAAAAIPTVPLPLGFSNARVFGANELGDVVGLSFLSMLGAPCQEIETALFVRRDGMFQPITGPGRTTLNTWFSLNQWGMVAFSMLKPIPTDCSNTSRVSALWSNGQVRPIEVPSSVGLGVFGISAFSEMGDIVGRIGLHDGQSVLGALRADGSLVILQSLPGTDRCQASSINVEGTVVGACAETFIENGKPTALGIPVRWQLPPNVAASLKGILDGIEAISSRQRINAAVLDSLRILIRESLDRLNERMEVAASHPKTEMTVAAGESPPRAAHAGLLQAVALLQSRDGRTGIPDGLRETMILALQYQAKALKP